MPVMTRRLSLSLTRTSHTDLSSQTAPMLDRLPLPLTPMLSFMNIVCWGETINRTRSERTLHEHGINTSSVPLFSSVSVRWRPDQEDKIVGSDAWKWNDCGPFMWGALVQSSFRSAAPLAEFCLLYSNLPLSQSVCFLSLHTHIPNTPTQATDCSVSTHS